MGSKTLSRRAFGLALLLWLLAACGGARTKPTALPEPSSTPSPSPQTFSVIPAYEGVSAYVEAARAAPEADWPTLFQQYVVESYWEDCAAGGEYEMLAKGAVANHIKDLDYLTRAVDALRQSDVEGVVESALQEAASVLPGPNTSACIFVADPQNSLVRHYMNGVVGLAAGSGKIWIQIYPEGAWRDWVAYTVAHEYHHSVWTDRHFNLFDPFDLVDYLVFEGRADSFARLVYPEMAAPWTEALVPAQEAEQWLAMQPYLDSTSVETHRRFMFGGYKVARWTGYTIGFHIVQSYLQRHPDVGVDEWTAMDAHDLLEASGYSPEQ